MSKGPIQKDTTLTKLFVGGLPYHTKDETLKEYFDKFGQIEEAVVITDRATGKSKGYGFVTMASAEDAKAACQDPNPIIEGRKANVNLAILGAKQRTIPSTIGGIPVGLKAQGLPGISAAGLQAIPMGLQGQYGIPFGSQLLYQPASYGSTQGLMVSPHSPLSTNATPPYFDYNQYIAAAAAAQYPANYDQYTALASAGGFIQPSYTHLGAVPQAALAETAAGLAGYAHPQQLQERLQ